MSSQEHAIPARSIEIRDLALDDAQSSQVTGGWAAWPFRNGWRRTQQRQEIDWGTVTVCRQVGRYTICRCLDV